MRKVLALAVLLASSVGLAEPASAAMGPQTFVLFQRTGQHDFTVIAKGPISGIGTDVLLSEGFDPSTGARQRMTETVFPQGSTYNTLTVTSNAIRFDPNRCVAQINGTSHLETTGGTGAYEGATGSGEVTFQAYVVNRRTATGCSQEVVSSFSLARVSGTATVPG